MISLGFILSLKLFILLLDSPGNQNSQLQFPLRLPYKVNDTQFPGLSEWKKKNSDLAYGINEGFKLAKNNVINLRKSLVYSNFFFG